MSDKPKVYLSSKGRKVVTSDGPGFYVKKSVIEGCSIIEMEDAPMGPDGTKFKTIINDQEWQFADKK